jgi:hypothetical protein
MHDLEHKLLTLAVSVERGTITAKRLASKLVSLASQSHDYIPDPGLTWNEDGTRNYRADQERRLRLLEGGSQ